MCLELEEPVGDDVEDQLRVAEQELLEARASYTIRRRAIETVLMTDPVLKAVHLKATTPAERFDSHAFSLHRPVMLKITD